MMVEIFRPFDLAPNRNNNDDDNNEKFKQLYNYLEINSRD